VSKVASVQSLDIGSHSFCHSMIRCSKSAQKFAVCDVRSLMLLWKPCSWF